MPHTVKHSPTAMERRQRIPSNYYQMYEVNERFRTELPGCDLVAAGDGYLVLAYPHVNAVTAEFRTAFRQR